MNPVPRGRLLPLVAAALVTACTASTGVAPTPKPELAQPSIIDNEPLGGTPGPITYPPDNMWAFLSTTPGLEPVAETLAEASAYADAVLVGRFVGVERGGGYGAPGEPVGWYAVALVDVDSTLKGTPNLDAHGFLRVPFLLTLDGNSYPEKEFADLERSLPQDPALLLLVSWATYFDRAGGNVPTWLDELNADNLYRTIGGDGAIRVVNGELTPPPYSEGWPAELLGGRLEDVVGLIAAPESSPYAP